MLPNLSNLPLVAAVGVGSPSAKRPRTQSDPGSPSAIAPTEGRWWPVNDGVFRVSVTREDQDSFILSILADPTQHDPGNRPCERPEAVCHLWDQGTLIRESSLGQGYPVVAVYTARPNIKGYPVTEEEQANEQRGMDLLNDAIATYPVQPGKPVPEEAMDTLYQKILGERLLERDRFLIHAFGANETSLPPTRVPDEIHLIVNLLTPNPGGCGWCTMAVGIVPVPVNDEDAQNEALGALMASCPFVEVDVVGGQEER